jgi:hypothetical protein
VALRRIGVRVPVGARPVGDPGAHPGGEQWARTLVAGFESQAGGISEESRVAQIGRARDGEYGGSRPFRGSFWGYSSVGQSIALAARGSSVRIRLPPRRRRRPALRFVPGSRQEDRFTVPLLPIWGCSSSGRALSSQGRGTGFDPPHLHKVLPAATLSQTPSGSTPGPVTWKQGGRPAPGSVQLAAGVKV